MQAAPENNCAFPACFYPTDPSILCKQRSALRGKRRDQGQLAVEASLAHELSGQEWQSRTYFG